KSVCGRPRRPDPAHPPANPAGDPPTPNKQLTDMAKELKTKIKLQCPGGQATPAPPVGPAPGAHGVNTAEFFRQFNDRTKQAAGLIIPVEISVFTDRSFSFIT